MAQADTLTSILEGAEKALDVVIQIEVPEDELVRRALGRQRDDDTEEVIKNRLRVYEENTAGRRMTRTDRYRERDARQAFYVSFELHVPILQ